MLKAPAITGPLRIPSLDGLRTVAIAVVFFSHAGLRAIIPGTFGVTIFFFLSGYLITTLLRVEWAKAGRISLRQFYLRRVLRIFPPLYLALAFATVVTLAGLLPAPLTWKALAAEVFFVANYFKIYTAGYGMPPGMLVLWSLAVEEHFYLFFPLVFAWLQRLGLPAWKQALAFSVACAAVLAWRFVLVHALGVDASGTAEGWDQGWHRLAESTDTRLDSLLFGCILAVWGNPALDPSRFSERTWKYLLAPLGLTGLLASFAWRGPEFRETLRYTLQGVALGPIFVVAIRFPGWAPVRPLGWRWVERLGVLSYTFYLVHDTFLEAAARLLGGPTVLGGAAALALSIGFCELSDRFVEKPCAELRRRLSRAAPARGVAGQRL